MTSKPLMRSQEIPIPGKRRCGEIPDFTLAAAHAAVIPWAIT
jgi:hypothetical protein